VIGNRGAWPSALGKRFGSRHRGGIFFPFIIMHNALHSKGRPRLSNNKSEVGEEEGGGGGRRRISAKRWRGSDWWDLGSM